MLRKFLRDRRGNYAVIGALTTIPLVGAMALAVDFSEWTRQKQSLLNSLDAAGIATARQFMAGANEAETKAYAEQFFRANIGAARWYETTLSAVVPTVANPRDDVELTATIRYKPLIYPRFRALMGLTGGDTIDFTAVSRVKVQNTLEVALVLDNSGSMDEYGTGSSKRRITVLKEAASALVTTLSQRAAMMKKVDAPVRFALVPFAASVNVGPSYDDADWMDTEGKSPVHHENFNWPASLTIATNQRIDLVNGKPYKKGTAWPVAQRDTLVTRFTMYSDLKRRRSSGSTLDPAATWQGCVEARPDPYNSNGAPAVQSDAASLIVPMFAPDEHDDVTYSGYRYKSDNNWWADDSAWAGSYTGARNKSTQRDMKKYFTPAASSSGSVSGLNVGPNLNCTTTPVTPLADVSTTAGADFIKTKISQMAALGGTDVPEGMAWGWHLLSSAPPFTDGKPESENGNDKVIIVLTDGQNTYYPANGNDLATNRSDYSAYGYVGQTYDGTSDTRLFKNTTTPVIKTTHSVDNYGKALDQHFTRLCNNAKAGKVIVMTIALDLNDSGTVDNNPEKRQIELLRDCASHSKFRLNADGSKKKLFWNSKSSTLADDFKDLGEELSNLRIVG